MSIGARVKIGLIVVGCVLGYYGFKELKLNRTAQTVAQSLTCAQLLQSGPGENAHISMSDLLLCDFAYIYAEESGRWAGAWVPAVPMNGPYHTRVMELLEQGVPEREIPMPKNIGLIVKLPDARGEDDVTTAAAQATLQGMVVNEIESLGSEEKRVLKESYPAVDFNACYIFEVGRRPAGAGKLFGLFGGGALCFVVVGLWWLFSRMGDDGSVGGGPVTFEPRERTFEYEREPVGR